MENITVGIYGLGLIGGSVALAVKERIPGSKVYGFGRDVSKLQTAKKLGMIDAYGEEDSEFVQQLDVFIIGTPVDTVPLVFSKFMKNLPEDCITMDVGSVKRSVLDGVAKINTRKLCFVGAHPMAGSEKSGLEFARADLFEKKIVAIVGDDHQEEEIIARVRDFWKVMSAQIVLVSADFHDEIVAATSHAPHLIASAISRYLEKDGWSEVRFFGLYGRGLLDTTRIAQGNPQMWTDILIANADNVERSLVDFTKEIDTLIHLIRNQKRKELTEYLSCSKEFREKL